MSSSISIAIPTFNRCNSLLRLIKSVFPLSIKYQIPIVIVDNNSSDTTHLVCSELSKRHKLISYVRNHVNIGMEMNILRSLLLSNTSHVWCIGDDDELCPDIVDSFIKYDYYDSILNSDATFFVNRMEVITPVEGPILFESFCEFARHFYVKDIEVLTGITWISGVVVKRSLIDARIAISSLNQNFIHTHSYLKNIIDSRGSVSIIRQRLVREQQYKMQRSADSKSYLDNTFQKSIYQVLDRIAAECGLKNRISYSSYIQEISLRYNIPPYTLLMGHSPWQY
jgi:glycosyltransferase involved in cell wall biosynthesis